MSKSSEAVKRWRKNIKRKIVEGYGGKCFVCGYDRCDSALDLHHVDPDKKEYGLGKVIAKPIRWEKLVNEIKKCVLVCANCHREIHAGLIKCPELREFKKPETKSIKDICPVCGGLKSVLQKTCSHNCAAKLSRKVDWDHIDLVELLKKHSISEVGELLNVTEVAVRKRMKKLGIYRLTSKNVCDINSPVDDHTESQH